MANTTAAIADQQLTWRLNPLIPETFRLLWKGSFTLAAFACCLSAVPITYTATNLTASGGDPTYSIATDVTFNNLSLSETFSDASSIVVPLFDFTNTARTSLTTSTFDLHSLTLDTSDPLHGNLVSAVLTGSFSSTNLSIVSSFGGTPTSVTVAPNFTATLLANAQSVDVLAISVTGASYAAGTLQSAVTTAPVPEPATYGVGLLGLSAVYFATRFRRRS